MSERIVLTDAEKGAIGLMRYNAAVQNDRYRGEIDWSCNLGRRIQIRIIKNSRKRPWGRFGGGWNWELGFQASSSTVILNLLVLSVRIYRPKKVKEGS